MTNQKQIKNGIDDLIIAAVEVSSDTATIQFTEKGKTYFANLNYKEVIEALDEADIICTDKNQFGFTYFEEKNNNLGLTDAYVRLVNRVITPTTPNHDFTYSTSWAKFYTLKDTINKHAAYIVQYCQKDEEYSLNIEEGKVFTEEEVRHINYVHPRRPILTQSQMYQLGMI